jgi:ribosomal protein L37AE/L43A
MSDTSSPNESTIVVHPAVNLALNKKPACIFCHKRKIKCNSQWPCDNCNKRGQECEYEDVLKLRNEPCYQMYVLWVYSAKELSIII